MNTIEKDNKYIANTYARFSVSLVRGSGSLVYDENGKEYIDLATGIAVNSFGIGDEEWKSAVIAQLNAIPHTSNLYYSQPSANLAELICNRTGMKKVFFGNSGAEANECAIKTARKYSEDKYGKGRHTIITLVNSFHGRTLATLAATGQDVFHETFTPMPEGFCYVHANDLSELELKISAGGIAAVMLEVVQGEGGVLPLKSDYLNGVQKLCRDKDILFIIDEVQCGNGRSGELYAYMNYALSPDIVTTAKGLGGGLPLGACILGDKVENTLTPSSHGSTFGGNPVATAGAFSILSRIDRELLDGVKRKSQFIIDTLTGKSGIVGITGLGLMLGIETVKPASEVINYCAEHGVLVIKAKNKVRLLPALNIPDELLKKAVGVIIDACK